MDAHNSSPSRQDDPGIRVFPGNRALSSGTFDKPLHLAIGMFDGVHLGHQAVIRQAVEAAARNPGDFSGVLTFDPHPSRILNAARTTPLLMPLDQRIERMFMAGVDHVFVQAFTLEYARREAADFAASLRALFPGLKSLHVGENFRFGARRSGDVDTLERTGRSCGIEVHALRREIRDGQPISSSSIREALSEGRIRDVNGMLGYPYTIQGKVEPGQQVGRGLGFPTLNIPWVREAAPRFGVYRTWVRTEEDGPVLHGIANYGVRPTVGGTRQPLLEVHLLNAHSIPATGETVRIALLEFMRPEKVFHSIDALKEQIAADVEAARAAFLRQAAELPGNF